MIGRDRDRDRDGDRDGDGRDPPVLPKWPKNRGDVLVQIAVDVETSTGILAFSESCLASTVLVLRGRRFEKLVL